jgi:putative nucleotidyltransferase with HDIG domain
MNAEELILSSCEIPSVPMVAMRIVRLVENPNVAIDDLQDVIMADQALAVRVLRMANSAFYGMRRKVETISEAILAMGFAAIKNLALAVSTRGVYKNFGLLEQKMWEHSIGVSVASGLLARETGIFKPEEAVMAGLLHDIGKVIMNNSHPDKFLHLTQRVYEEAVPYARIETGVFGFGHAEAGWLFARKWEFPGFLCDAIRWHHGGGEEALCRVVSLADTMSLRLGIGARSPLEGLDDEETRKALSISDGRFTELLGSFREAYVQEKMQYQE